VPAQGAAPLSSFLQELVFFELPVKF
jgi:hypothetical protein